MPKYRVVVTKVFCKEEIVEADDKDHALGIGMEIEDFMETDFTTYAEGEWDATLCKDQSVKATYTPEQDYLK